MIADVYSTSNRPPELFVMPNRAGATHDAADDVADRGVARVPLDRAGDREDSGIGRRAGAGAHLPAEGHGRAA